MTKPVATIKTLMPDDWESYRAVWLECLQNNPGSFTVSAQQEEKKSEWYWRATCHTPHKIQSFMLFQDNDVVGISTIECTNAGPCKTAFLLFGCVRKQYQGQGYGVQLYQPRLKWAMDEGIECLVTDYRKNNEIAQAVGKKCGFMYDGVIADRVFNGVPDEIVRYRLNLSDLAGSLPEQKPSSSIQLLINQ